MFTVPLLKERPLNLEESRILIKGVVSFQKINNLLEENPTHLDISSIRLKNISKEWEQTWDNVIKINEGNKQKLTSDNIAFVEITGKMLKIKLINFNLLEAWKMTCLLKKLQLLIEKYNKLVS